MNFQTTKLRTLLPPQTNTESPKRRRRAGPNHHDDPPSLQLPVDPEESDEPDEIETPCTDDAHWEIFLPDEDDPLPEPGDFWIDAPEELLGYCRPEDLGDGDWRTTNDD
jgi:hypothetical protein